MKKIIIYFASNLKGHLKTLIEENFKDSVEYVFRDPILFGDYRTALDEAEPRLYEDIQDFDASKALFQEVRFFPELFSAVRIVGYITVFSLS